MTDKGLIGYLAIALGGIVFVIGLMLVSEAAPEAAREGPVVCGDKEMRAGDVCWTIGDGIDIPARNYQTMAAEQLSGHGWTIWLLCLGILLSLGAVIVTGLYLAYVRMQAGKGS
ncbi:hypothetical protein [Amycolatopsis pittospori]|uniref:hypothetical protein n=1 Tax=Amycolatopsis pittospori TaxID=2749434 RepID=UPI0015F0ACFB|nr:hypothetical protein [Amycolatopsis pittospori]